MSSSKATAFVEWQAQQQTRACAQNLAEEATGLKAATDGVMAEHLGTVLAGRFAQLLTGWNGVVDEEFRKQLRCLQMLCQNITLMRREEVRSERLQLEKEKRIRDEKSTQARALELCLEEAEKFPEVREAFSAAFQQLDEAEGIDVRPQPARQEIGVGSGPTGGGN